MGSHAESQENLSPFEYIKRDSAAMASATRTMKQFKSRTHRSNSNPEPASLPVSGNEERVLGPCLCTRVLGLGSGNEERALPLLRLEFISNDFELILLEFISNNFELKNKFYL